MNVTMPIPSPLHLRREAEQAPTSGIVDVFNYGRNREGLIPLWVGEGDLPTPVIHLRCRRPLSGGRRDVLHLSARHPRIAAGHRPLP